MSKSLQDQLLKAGLANKKQAVKAKKAKNHKEKQKRTGAAVVDEAAANAEAARLEKVERDRELNRQKQAQAEEKAVQAQIRQLILLNRIEERGDIDFSYTLDTKIRTLKVTEPMRRALVSGALTLALLDDVEILPRAAAEKISERDASRIVLNNTTTSAGADSTDDEDDYAQFQVPDDLMW